MKRQHKKTPEFSKKEVREAIQAMFEEGLIGRYERLNPKTGKLEFVYHALGNPPRAN